MPKHSQVFKFKPRVKQRPRLGRRGRVFTPAQTLEFENKVKSEYNGPLAEYPVDVSISLYKDKFRVTITEHVDHSPSGLRGDIDNYAKAILDGLNKVAYTDDRLVKKLLITKHE